jgi:hypothetical protein
MPGARLPPQGAAAFVQSDAGDIRIGPILAIPQVLQALHARPQTAFDRAGVRMSLFRDPDARLPLEVAGRLFFESARLADCPHFALLVGERFNLDGLGPLGELMRHSPSVGAALRSLLLHLQLHDRGAAPLLLQTERDTSVLGYSVYRHFTPGAEFIYDVAVTIGHRILLGLCGPDFVPQTVQFSYRRPARTAAYRRLFRAPLHFDAEVSGLVFASTWLARPIEGADPGAPPGAHARAATGAGQRAAEPGRAGGTGAASAVAQWPWHGRGRGAAVWHQPAHLAAPARCGRQKLPDPGQSHPP